MSLSLRKAKILFERKGHNDWSACNSGKYYWRFKSFALLKLYTERLRVHKNYKQFHNGYNEHEDGRNQKDKCGQDLLPAEIGGENQDLAADNPSFQLTGEDEEDNVDKEAHNSKEKQEDGGTDDDQYVVNPLKGIHNEGLETGDEELHSSTREGSKQQSLSEKLESEDNEGNSEAIQESDKSDTLVEVAKL